MTPTQRDAWDRLAADWSIPMQPHLIDFGSVFGRTAPVVLEIGCGMGHATVAQAKAQPNTDILAVDVHTPGLGNLLAEQERAGVTNVRVMQADVVEVIGTMLPIGSLSGVRIYFPDPWPKPRHRKRRLVQAEFVDLLVARIEPGGFIECATDDLDYGRQMVSVFDAHAGLTNEFDGFAPRPESRPVTKFERRARSQGRPVVDVVVTRTLVS